VRGSQNDVRGILAGREPLVDGLISFVEWSNKQYVLGNIFSLHHVI
jgi:hypothetical protein